MLRQLRLKLGISIFALAVAGGAGLVIAGEPLLAVLFVIIAMGIIFYTHRSLLPLEDITQVVEGIADGDLKHAPIEVERLDEIGRLADSTNQMIEQLSSLSDTAEQIARGEIGVVDVEDKVLESGRLADANIELGDDQGDLERSFARMTNQMRRLTIQARIIARDDLYNPLLDERVPGELGESFALMVRNLRTIADRAKDIAEGDLTSYVDGDGDLTTAFNQMVTGLNGLVQQIAETAIHISSASEQILVVLQDQELAASHQASGVEETQRTMETLLESARKIADNSQTVYKSAEKTQANNRTVAERIGELKSHTARITEILEVIKSIADRSDLLALNAGLEGMRAGEAGKGFTLVADEMRRLAENIKDSIGDIKELVSDIRESSMATVMATEEGSRLSEQTTETALQISLITQQQKSGTEQVTQSMEELSQLINQGVAGTRQVTTAARDLAETAEDLSDLIGEFEVVDPPESTAAGADNYEPRTDRSQRASSPGGDSTASDFSTVDPRSTLTRSRQFARRAQQTEANPTVPASEADPDHNSQNSGDPSSMRQQRDSDELNTPTIKFSSPSDSEGKLRDELEAMKQADLSSDRSGEFETIARDIESDNNDSDDDSEPEEQPESK